MLYRLYLIGFYSCTFTVYFVIHYILILQRGYGFQCPLYINTGLYCAGCGSTRFMIQLIHLEFVKALQSNILLPIILICIPYYVYQYIRFGVIPKKLSVLIIFIAVIYTILRNVSGFELLLPIQ